MNKLAVIVGHSQKSQGTRWVYAVQKTEFEYNSEVARLIYRFCLEWSLDCEIFTKETNSNLDTRSIYTRVNKWAGPHNACAIELHFNACPPKDAGKAMGTEVLYDMDPPDSLELARTVSQNVCRLFKRDDKTNRKLKLRIPNDDHPERGDLNLGLLKITGCLVEPFFGDNITDASLGNFLQYEYAKTLAMAARAFLEAKEKSSKMRLN
jgi:N-acetylmuramoyl-L-alanine amidase